MAENAYVLDTSAWLTLMEDEPGAEDVQKLLERTGPPDGPVVLSSFMSYMEVTYITLQERDEAEARARLSLMDSLPVLRVESDRALAFRAATLKARYRLSLADAWIAALALEAHATLVHKDPEFDSVRELTSVLRLRSKSEVEDNR